MTNVVTPAMPPNSRPLQGRTSPSTPSPLVSSQLHLPALDGIRGLASLYVLLHHVWLASYPKSIDGPACGICLDAPPALGWLKFGHLAVAIFIVVSGFSLALSPLRHGDRLPDGYFGFMRRRAFRILPPYWMALLLSCLVVVFFTGQFTGTSIDLKTVLVHSALLNNLIDSAKPNGTFWSIAVEWQIYFLFPLLLLICRRFSPSKMALVALVCVVAAYLLGNHHSLIAIWFGLAPGSLSLLEKLLHLSPQFLALFALGMLAPHAAVLGASHQAGHLSWPILGAVTAVLSMVALGLMATAVIESNLFWIDLVIGASVAALLAGVMRRPNSWAVRSLGTKPLRWLGQSSYSLYLTHAPILEVILFSLVRPLGLTGDAAFILQLIVVVPVVLVCSRVFWRFFERPFIEHRSLRSICNAAIGRRITA